jgi:hypothetical protein
MKYAVEMGLNAMMYIPVFIKTGLAIQKLLGWTPDAQHGEPNFIFIKIRKVGCGSVWV